MVFSDLSGYTAINQRLDPEQVERITSRIKAEAVRIVDGHGGFGAGWAAGSDWRYFGLKFSG